MDDGSGFTGVWCTRKAITPEPRYLCTEITDHKLVYDQETRYLGTEITGNLQNTTSNVST